MNDFTQMNQFTQMNKSIEMKSFVTPDSRTDGRKEGRTLALLYSLDKVIGTEKCKVRMECSVNVAFQFHNSMDAAYLSRKLRKCDMSVIEDIVYLFTYQ